MKSKEEFLEIVKDYFYALKEEALDEDRYLVGVEEEKDFDIDGEQFIIKVDGYWEKSTWFDWEVKDSKGEIIYSDTEYL